MPMPNCESCGMPMEKAEDFGGGRVGNKYCVHCANAQGNLKSREEVREGMTRFFMTQGLNAEEAAKKVDEHMAKMPAWRS